MPQRAPSPSSASKRGVSCGVLMTQDVADAGQHQRAERVVDHRLVVHRQQLLADRERRRMQPRAGAAGEDDAFAVACRCVVFCECVQRFRSLRRAGARRPPATAAVCSAEGVCAACACRGANCAGARAGVGIGAAGHGLDARRAPTLTAVPVRPRPFDDEAGVAVPARLARRRGVVGARELRAPLRRRAAHAR